jgi:plastocyanin
MLAGAVLAAVLAACGTGAPTGSIDPATADVIVSADNLAFDQTEVSVPAGVPFTILFKNLEGEPHNIAIYTDASRSERLFAGEVITNAETLYEVPALQAGSHFFDCQLHPEMIGTMTAG